MGNASGEINLSILKNGICVVPLVLQFYKKPDSSIGVHVSCPQSSREEARGKGSFNCQKETDSRTNLRGGNKNMESELFKNLSSLREMQRISGTKDSLQNRSNYKELKKNSPCLEKEPHDYQFSGDSLRMIKNN